MKLKVLTLNIWGLNYLDAVRVRERFKHVADEVLDYDIVALQEVFSLRDFNYLKGFIESTFPYSHYHYSGIAGSGLCLFSRYPMIAVFSHTFYASGGVYGFADGEVFAGKGIVGYRLQTPIGTLAMFNTHVNPRCRDSQVFEIMQFVRSVRSSDPVIVVGDFNTKPKHLPYSLMTKCLGLNDVFEPDPVDTCDLASNIFTKKGCTPKRIDFIFHSDELSSHVFLDEVSHRLALTGHIPGKNFPYSDHEGVEAVFEIDKRETPQSVAKERPLSNEAIEVLRGVADTITKKHDKLKARHGGGEWVVSSWGLVFLLSFIVALVLSSSAVYSFLAGYYLQLLTTGCAALVSAGSLLYVMATFIDINISRSLAEDLSEIDAIIKYHRPSK